MNNSTLTNSAFSGKNIKVEQFDGNEKLSVQEKLEKKLGPEYISTRPGAGGVRVSYIEGWKAVNLANAIFGFNGWCSEVKNITVDYLDSNNGKYGVGISATIRVILKDGAYHEDIGYGSIENARSKAAAFEKAKKEAVTDGLKRALRSFGNAMGNCLYDKDYLKRIHGVKVAPPDFDESNLMRYSDTAPNTRANTIPSKQDESTIQQPIPQAQPARHSSSVPSFAPQRSPTVRNTTRYPPPQALRNNPPVRTIPEKRSLETPTNPKFYKDLDFDDSLTFSDELQPESDNDDSNELLDSKKTNVASQQNSYNSNTSNSTVPDETNKENSTPPPSVIKSQSEQVTRNPSVNGQVTNNDSNRVQTPTQEVVINLSQLDENQQEIDTAKIPTQVGFFTARVAEKVQNNNADICTDQFNPHFSSPSIRGTVDQSKSAPIKRTTPLSDKTLRFDNPKMIPNRQIGKPRYPPPKRAKLGDTTELQNP